MVARNGWCIRAADGLATSPVARCSQADLRNTGGAGSRQPMQAAQEMLRRTLPDGRLNPLVPQQMQVAAKVAARAAAGIAGVAVQQGAKEGSAAEARPAVGRHGGAGSLGGHSCSAQNGLGLG